MGIGGGVVPLRLRILSVLLVLRKSLKSATVLSPILLSWLRL